MYAKLFEKLNSEGVTFLVLGGAAVSLHGFTRMTADIDILLQNSRENVRRFMSVIATWGEKAGVNLAYDDFQGPGCVRIMDVFPLDVFTVLDGRPYEYFSERAANIKLADGVMVPCLGISDLIDLKQRTLREKDQLDVSVLRRLQDQSRESDPPYINLGPEPTAPD